MIDFIGLYIKRWPLSFAQLKNLRLLVSVIGGDNYMPK